jgi:formate dehydrogenase iron-sulfur subunit
VKIRYKETERSDGSLAWTFVRNSCRHCVNPPCKEAAVNPDSITIDAQTGAVIYHEGTKDESYAKIRLACPFDIPRQAPDGQLHKCLMCTDRVHNGEFPACVKTCTAGGLKFGDREEVLAMADARVAELSAEFPNARILDRRDVRLLILVTDPADFYALTTRD